MVACVGAHHLSGKLHLLGHNARLMPAKYVPTSAMRRQSSRRVQRPTMKFVATKIADQLALQALHRLRECLVGQRTVIINQIRAFLLEQGVAVRQGLHFLRAELPGILATRTDVRSPGWCASSTTCQQIGAARMRASKASPARLNLSPAKISTASG
jgi:transposase